MTYTKHSINNQMYLCSEALALLVDSRPPLTLNSCQRIFRIKCYVVNVLNVHSGLLLAYSLSPLLAASLRCYKIILHYVLCIYSFNVA